METLTQKIEDFLNQKNIAVAGVTRNHPNEAANAIYRKLKSAGYNVFAVNPNAESVEGDRCYPDLQSISESLDGVVVVTKPFAAEDVVRECAEIGVPRVWMQESHRTILELCMTELRRFTMCGGN